MCSDGQWSGWEEGSAARDAGRGRAAADPERDEEEDSAADGQQLDPPALRQHRQGAWGASHAQVEPTQLLQEEQNPFVMCDGGGRLFTLTNILFCCVLKWKHSWVWLSLSGPG